MLGGDGETHISGVMLELVPEGRLVLSWLEEDAGWAHPARLVATLEPTAAGTRVGLIHDGFRHGPGVRARHLTRYEAYWAEALVRLRDLATADDAGPTP